MAVLFFGVTRLKHFVFFCLHQRWVCSTTQVAAVCYNLAAFRVPSFACYLQLVLKKQGKKNAEGRMCDWFRQHRNTRASHQFPLFSVFARTLASFAPCKFSCFARRVVGGHLDRLFWFCLSCALMLIRIAALICFPVLWVSATGWEAFILCSCPLERTFMPFVYQQQIMWIIVVGFTFLGKVFNSYS